MRGTHALLLAAGNGSRFGGGKLTAFWRGEPLVLAAARIALASPAERVTVVTGSDAIAVTEVLVALDDDRLVVVENARWSEGLASSLRAGLLALPSSTERVILFLGDMPLIHEALAGELLDAMADAPAILPTSGGEPAHPVIFTASLIPTLLKLQGDRGARPVLAALPGARVVDIGAIAATVDVDTPEDLAALDLY